MTRTPSSDGTFGARRRSLAFIVFAAFGSGVAWGVHFNVVYVLNTWFCNKGYAGNDLVVYGTTVLFAAVSAWAGVLAWREWRARADTGSLTSAFGEPGGWMVILMVLGTMGGGVFTLFIVLQGLAPAFVPACSLAIP